MAGAFYAWVDDECISKSREERAAQAGDFGEGVKRGCARVYTSTYCWIYAKSRRVYVYSARISKSEEEMRAGCGEWERRSSAGWCPREGDVFEMALPRWRGGVGV